MAAEDNIFLNNSRSNGPIFKFQRDMFTWDSFYIQSIVTHKIYFRIVQKSNMAAENRF